MGEEPAAIPLDEEDAWQELRSRIERCRACPRLVAHRERVALHPPRSFRGEVYWARPVPGFGDPSARLLVLGLAPAAHGANRTGRMFTGDSSGDWLFRALHRAGFANRPDSHHRDDGLVLRDCYITATCRCAPPDNRPTAEERSNCRPFLHQEIQRLQQVQVIVTLGRVAFDTALRVFRESGRPWPGDGSRRPEFRHGRIYRWSQEEGLPHLVACYHPSRQNTQTGVLTEAMLDEVFQTARRLLT